MQSLCDILNLNYSHGLGHRCVARERVVTSVEGVRVLPGDREGAMRRSRILWVWASW
jgi:hypothetical protein